MADGQAAELVLHQRAVAEDPHDAGGQADGAGGALVHAGGLDQAGDLAHVGRALRDAVTHPLLLRGAEGGGGGGGLELRLGVPDVLVGGDRDGQQVGGAGVDRLEGVCQLEELDDDVGADRDLRATHRVKKGDYGQRISGMTLTYMKSTYLLSEVQLTNRVVRG